MIKKALKSSIILFLVILLFSLSTIPALAFDSRSGMDVTVASGEVINNDLYIVATNITIDGTVNGDVFIAGQTIRINGTINGGVTAAGQTISLNGNVSAGARLAGQTISVGGSISRDLLVAASDLTITDSAVINRDLNSYSNMTVINGHVLGNVTGSINNLTISSEINGNVIVRANSLLINPTANIHGNLDYTSENTANIQTGATISGTTQRTIPPRNELARGWVSGVVGGALFRVFSYLSIFIIGLIIVALGRRSILSLALAINDHPALSLGWGALLFFITPIAAFVVMVTIIGLPLGIISLLVWGILLYLSQIPVAILIGWLILSRRRTNHSYGFTIGMLALGLAILYIISAIPIFGWIMWMLVMIFGLGSLVTVLQYQQNNKPATPQP